MGYYFDTGRILHTNNMDYYVVHVHLVDMLFSTRPFVTTMCGLSSSLAPLLTLRFSTCVPTEYLSHGLIHEKLVLVTLSNNCKHALFNGTIRLTFCLKRYFNETQIGKNH